MIEKKHNDGRAGIDAALVKRLLAAQFPQWSDLPIEPVEKDGWDNRTYRLGADLTVRLPTGSGYAPAVEKEHRWLPFLAPHLPVPIPESLGLGEPGEGYPHHWSVRRWIDGETAERGEIADLTAFAIDVGQFLVALRNVDATGGPLAGEHSFYRGDDLAHYDQQSRESLEILSGRIDTRLATEVWETALASEWTGAPVWFHGDIAVGNLLVRDGRLSAVIDFGTSGVGDPACELVFAWTTLSGESRKAFRDTVGLDEDTWARGRGWAIWKAMLMVAKQDTDPEESEENLRVIAEICAEHSAA